MYINEIPKTSPNSRNGIEDIYYQIAHGKQALMEKRENKVNNENISLNPPKLNPTISKVGPNQTPLINNIL